MDQRTTMHGNGFWTIFQHSWKIVRNSFACMVVLQSMWRGPNHCWNVMESGSESATYGVCLVPDSFARYQNQCISVSKYQTFVHNTGHQIQAIGEKKLFLIINPESLTNTNRCFTKTN